MDKEFKRKLTPSGRTVEGQALHSIRNSSQVRYKSPLRIKIDKSPYKTTETRGRDDLSDGEESPYRGIGEEKFERVRSK